MQITLFGGSFNPPHLGHALVIAEFLESGFTDQLWLLPTAKHAFDKKLVDHRHRLAMTNLLIEFVNSNLKPKNTKLKLCPIEIDLDLSGKTFDTIQALKTTDYVKKHMDPSLENQNLEFSFLIGSDLLTNFKNWHRWEELLKETPFWVYERAGHPITDLQTGIKLFDTPNKSVTNISSTQIRNKIQNNQNHTLLLPDSIITYIKQHNLYK